MYTVTFSNEELEEMKANDAVVIVSCDDDNGAPPLLISDGFPRSKCLLLGIFLYNGTMFYELKNGTLVETKDAQGNFDLTQVLGNKYLEDVDSENVLLLIRTAIDVSSSQKISSTMV